MFREKSSDSDETQKKEKKESDAVNGLSSPQVPPMPQEIKQQRSARKSRASFSFSPSFFSYSPFPLSPSFGLLLTAPCLPPSLSALCHSLLTSLSLRGRATSPTSSRGTSRGARSRTPPRSSRPTRRSPREELSSPAGRARCSN